MPLKHELSKGANGLSLNVWGTMLLDGIEWQVSAWMHRRDNGRLELGLSTDSRLYALTHCLHASRLHPTSKSVQASPARRRRLALVLEYEANAAEPTKEH